MNRQKKQYVTSGFYSDIDDIDNIIRNDSVHLVLHSNDIKKLDESQTLSTRQDIKPVPLKIDLDELENHVSYILIKSSKLTRFQKWCLKHSKIIKVSDQI